MSHLERKLSFFSLFIMCDVQDILHDFVRTDLNATHQFDDIPPAKNKADHFITDGFSILNLNQVYVTFQRAPMTENVFSAQTAAVTGIMISRSYEPRMCILCHQ